MYDFTNLSDEHQIMLGSIVRNECTRAEKKIKRLVNDRDYQRHNAHIFNDGTIDATTRQIADTIARLEAVTKLLGAITIK